MRMALLLLASLCTHAQSIVPLYPDISAERYVSTSQASCLIKPSERHLALWCRSDRGPSKFEFGDSSVIDFAGFHIVITFDYLEPGDIAWEVGAMVVQGGFPEDSGWPMVFEVVSAGRWEGAAK